MALILTYIFASLLCLWALPFTFIALGFASVVSFVLHNLILTLKKMHCIFNMRRLNMLTIKERSTMQKDTK